VTEDADEDDDDVEEPVLSLSKRAVN